MRLRSGGIHRTFVSLVAAVVSLSLLGGTSVLAQTPSATPGAPPATLTLSTTYPSITVDPGGTARFPLQVTSPVVERVDLAVTGAPEGYTPTIKGGGLIVGSVTTTGTNASPALELDVEVPEGITPGVQRLTVTGVSPSGRTDLLVDVVVADTSGGDVSLESDFPVLRGAASQTFSFDLRLTNDTAQELTFVLEGTGPEGWDVQAQLSSQALAATAVVGAGDSENIKATVKPAFDAAAGQYIIDVAATAGDYRATSQLGVEITGSYSLRLTTADQRLSTNVTAGSSSVFPVLIQNTGSGDLTNVTLTGTPPTGWTVSFDTPTIASIPAGGEATANATITPADGAIAGDYVVTLAAKSDEVTTPSSIAVRTTVETSSMWGVVGVGLIVLVLIGLFLVFRRYGRR
jgi:uncharacterized membrane protein